MERSTLIEWVSSVLDERGEEDIFLVDLDWNQSTKKLVVYIDSDDDLSLQRCQAISRHIEKALDQSEMIGLTYALEVSSPGLDRPLVSPRQFQKNIGRVVRVVLHDGAVLVGKLMRAEQESILLALEQLKGKHKAKTYHESKHVDLEKIKETFVEIRF